MLNPKTLQTEQREWSLKNFGPHPALHPLSGMTEEIGELDDAIEAWNVPEIKDALSDAVIFCADYCTCKGWDMEALLPAPSGSAIAAAPSRDIDRSIHRAFRCVARAHHHELKTIQRIRGDRREHDRCSAESIRTALHHLESIAQHLGFTLMELAEPVWNKVKQRDFTKNRLDGSTNPT